MSGPSVGVSDRETSYVIVTLCDKGRLMICQISEESVFLHPVAMPPV